MIYQDKEEECIQEAFGNYIIERIHKEDLSLDKNISLNDDVEENEAKMIFEEKINITSLILKNQELLVNFEIFYEEDCQFSLLIWGYKSIKKFNLVKNKSLYRKNLEVLLFNIINIFEIFPIKPNDLISLNFIEKLNKINYTVKNFNLELYSKIKNLIYYWKNLISYYNSYINSQVSNNINFLNKKRKGKKEREENEKEEELSFISTNETLDYNSDNNLLKIKKNVSWKENPLLVEFCNFNPNKSPSEHE
jgi:hypothetical protein